MVSLAYVFFAVSTLSALTNALPEDHTVSHACGEETLCHIKPADYPQEEIDREVLKHLPQLQRLRRQVVNPRVSLAKVEDAEPGGNCYAETKNEPVYTIRDNNIQKYVVHSKWLAQNVTRVECKNPPNAMPCLFRFHLTGNMNTKCETRAVAVSLYVYSKANGFERVQTQIGVDCACVIVDKSTNEF